MHPALVTAPGSRVRNLGRWYIDPNGWWSVRELEWLNTETGLWDGAIGCRWNGSLNDERSIGHPNAFGNATWFILPQPFSQMAEALIEAAGMDERTAEPEVGG